jgi:lipid-A-disaccharide synthase
MLLKKPMVVAYRMAPLSWAIISRLVSTPFAALPNILARRQLVPEFLQREATTEALVMALLPLLQNPQAAAAQCRAFTDIHSELRLASAARSADALIRLAQASRDA